MVLIPFDLVTVDSLARECDDAEAPPVVMRILRLCQDRYLSDPGIVRDRAATLLARLLTRPDMPRALASFLDWATEALAKANAPHAPEDDEIEKTERAKAFAAAEQKATFLVPGVARALAAIFKLGTRGALLGVAERAWGDARDLAESPAARGALAFHARVPEKRPPWTKKSASELVRLWLRLGSEPQATRSARDQACD